MQTGEVCVNLVQPIFGEMQNELLLSIIKKEYRIVSKFLSREVPVDFYFPQNFAPLDLSLLLINDGQELIKMNFDLMLDQLFSSDAILPVVCVGIHAGTDRINEYGTVGVADYLNRGVKANAYQQFILKELIPFIHLWQGIENFESISLAGFSMGGLSAIDTAWSHPSLFSIVGVFSGSFWWRTKDLNKGYNEETDRIIHQKVKQGKLQRQLRFYFTTGSLDETADRNNNGIIDSIDDTLGLISELEKLGYKTGRDIRYLNYEEGRHDVETWAKAMPQFLMWGWRKK